MTVSYHIKDRSFHNEFNKHGPSVLRICPVSSDDDISDQIQMVLAGSDATVGPAGPPRLLAIHEKLAVISMRQFAEEYVADTILDSTPPEVRSEAVDMIGGMTIANYLETSASILSADITLLLAYIQCPVLVLVGQASP